MPIRGHVANVRAALGVTTKGTVGWASVSTRNRSRTQASQTLAMRHCESGAHANPPIRQSDAGRPPASRHNSRETRVSSHKLQSSPRRRRDDYARRWMQEYEGVLVMYGETIILPMDADGKIYAIQDEKGNIIGTGTREVCEILLYVIAKSASASVSGRINTPIQRRPNLRAAIAI